MKLILKAAITLGLISLLSCNMDSKETKKVQPAAQKPQTQKEEKKKATDYDHYNTNGLLWSTIENGLNPDSLGSKMTLIDVYTEWCSWCKIMDKKTFSDPEVQKYLQKNFNLVKFDAESRERIGFNGKTYTYKAAGKKGMHLLAAELLDGQMSYPTLVFIDENMDKVRVVRGYKNPTELLQELEIVTSL